MTILYWLAAVWIAGSVLIAGVLAIGVWRIGYQNYLDIISSTLNKPVSHERFHWALVTNVILWPVVLGVIIYGNVRSRR